MMIYIVRHGIAHEMHEKGITRDSERPLSPEGHRKTAAVAEGLRSLDVAPQRIVSSPLIRARETADIMAKILTHGLKVDLLDDLQPGGDPNAVIAWLNACHETVVMLVGHMPDVNDLTSILMVGQPILDIVFKKAAVACLESDGRVTPGKCRLHWLIQPGPLRELA